MADDVTNRSLADFQLIGMQAIGLDLFRHQIFESDMGLFVLGISRQPDDLHAIEQRPRDRVELVGGADEQHLAQIETHVEVMVEEVDVLFRIEHFEIGAVQHSDRAVRSQVARTSRTAGQQPGRGRQQVESVDRCERLQVPIPPGHHQRMLVEPGSESGQELRGQERLVTAGQQHGIAGVETMALDQVAHALDQTGEWAGFPTFVVDPDDPCRFGI